MIKNIGIKVKQPGIECNDKKCPFHGNLAVRGRGFVGTIIKKDLHGTATIEWTYKHLIPKYERKETRRTRLHVHNPKCINAEVGDIVRIMQTKPISKTKNFVVIENLGKEKGFAERMAAKGEAKFKEKEKKEEAETKEEEQE